MSWELAYGLLGAYGTGWRGQRIAVGHYYTTGFAYVCEGMGTLWSKHQSMIVIDWINNAMLWTRMQTFKMLNVSSSSYTFISTQLSMSETFYIQRHIHVIVCPSLVKHGVICTSQVSQVPWIPTGPYSWTRHGHTACCLLFLLLLLSIYSKHRSVLHRHCSVYHKHS